MRRLQREMRTNVRVKFRLLGVKYRQTTRLKSNLSPSGVKCNLKVALW